MNHYFNMTTTPETQAAIEQLRVDSIAHLAFLSSQEGLLILAHVAALEAELARLKALTESEWKDKPDQWTPAIEAAHPDNTDQFKTYETALEMVGNRNGKYELVDLVNWLLARAESAERERDEARAVNQSQLSLIKKQEDQHFATLEHNRALREALESIESEASALNDSLPEDAPDLLCGVKDIAAEALALTPADVESELTRLREGFKNYTANYEALFMASGANAKELTQLRSHISALIAAGDSQHARLVEYFKYLGEEIARLSLNESASTGVQRLSLECAKELDAWSNAKSSAQSNLPQ